VNLGLRRSIDGSWAAHASWEACGSTTTRPRPFDRRTSGRTFGEGVASPTSQRLGESETPSPNAFERAVAHRGRVPTARGVCATSVRSSREFHSAGCCAACGKAEKRSFQQYPQNPVYAWGVAHVAGYEPASHRVRVVVGRRVVRRGARPKEGALDRTIDGRPQGLYTSPPCWLRAATGTLFVFTARPWNSCLGAER